MSEWLIGWEKFLDSASELNYRFTLIRLSDHSFKKNLNMIPGDMIGKITIFLSSREGWKTSSVINRNLVFICYIEFLMWVCTRPLPPGSRSLRKSNSLGKPWVFLSPAGSNRFLSPLVSLNASNRNDHHFEKDRFLLVYLIKSLQISVGNVYFRRK
jgi:hypothetical protein